MKKRSSHKTVLTWLRRTIDPALDFRVDRVTKVRSVTRSGACTVVTANVVADGTPTAVTVRRCPGRPYDLRIVARR